MPPFEFPALVRDAASPGAAGSDIAVEPQSLHAAARQLRQAAEALPAAASGYGSPCRPPPELPVGLAPRRHSPSTPTSPLQPSVP